MNRQVIRGMSAWAAGLMLMSSTTTLEAQQRPIRLGVPMAGTLTAQDPKLPHRGTFHTYRLQARRGDRFVITMSSPAFEGEEKVSVLRTVEGLTEEVASAIRFDSRSEARLEFQAPETGSYVVVAQSSGYGRDWVGPYQLKVDAMQPAAPAVSAAGAAATAGRHRPIRVGATMNDSLTVRDPRVSPGTDDEAKGAFHTYRLEARRGDRFVIAMNSSEVDAHVWIAKTTGGITHPVGSSGLNESSTARLRFSAPEAGTYLVVAQSREQGGLGSYELKVDSLPPAPPAVAVELTPGQMREGVLTETSPWYRGEVPFQLYTVTGRGERLRVRMHSNAVKPAIRVTMMDPTGEVEVASNWSAKDEGVAFDADGQYLVYALSGGPSRTGAFAIGASVVPVRPIAARTIAVSQTMSGTISATDPENDAEQYFHQYSIDVPEGVALRIMVRSSDFDAFVSWGHGSGGRFNRSAGDDNGAGGTDAQLNISRMRRGGQFLIRVHGRESRKVGNYQLIVERQP